MRLQALLVFSVLVLVVLNFEIWKKEKLKAEGQSVLLQLAPVDPRSLMQGDYMRLEYALEDVVSSDEVEKQKERGHLVVLPNENNVASFVRFYDGEELAPKEMLIRYHKGYHDIQIVPHSFFFQEGHAKFYESARYGEFKCDSSGKHLLVALVNEQFKRIIPSDKEK